MYVALKVFGCAGSHGSGLHNMMVEMYSRLTIVLASRYGLNMQLVCEMFLDVRK